MASSTLNMEQMIVQALTGLNRVEGAERITIVKYLTDNFGVDGRKESRKFNDELTKMIAECKLEMVGVLFKLKDPANEGGAGNEGGPRTRRKTKSKNKGKQVTDEGTANASEANPGVRQSKRKTVRDDDSSKRKRVRDDESSGQQRTTRSQTKKG